MRNIRKEVVLLADVEMGAGNATDDFISDNALCKLIHELTTRKHAVDLVFNGDTFDFLKAPYQLKPKPTYTKHVTATIALEKLRLVCRAHPSVFTALSVFAAHENKHVYFIKGNHDLELAFSEVQTEMKARLDSQTNVHFPGLSYFKDGVYAEHGQQVDPDNHVYEDITHYKGKDIINHSYVSFAVIDSFLQLKEEHAFVERVRPIEPVMRAYKPVKTTIDRRMLKFFLKSIVYYSWKYYGDPAYPSPRGWIKVLRARMRDNNWEPYTIIDRFIEERKDVVKNSKVCVLGHIHKATIKNANGAVIIHPDTWRDEYYFDAQSKKLYPKQKNYVQVELYQSGQVQWKLVPVHLKRSTIDFQDLIEDEQALLKRVDKEEGYKRPA